MALSMSKSQMIPFNLLLLIQPFFPDVFLNREKFEDQRDAIESSVVNLIINEKQKKEGPISQYYDYSQKQNMLI